VKVYWMDANEMKKLSRDGYEEKQKGVVMIEAWGCCFLQLKWRRKGLNTLFVFKSSCEIKYVHILSDIF